MRQGDPEPLSVLTDSALRLALRLMAIFHLSVKPISRSAGRSSTAAAAYRAGVKITDERTGDVHDYTLRGGVEHAEIVLPPDAPQWATDREALWNAAEKAEKRKDACVAREYEVALPAELTAEERQRLVIDFARALAKAEGCAVDVCIHQPNTKGDQRNHHAHLLRTTRTIEEDGLGAKLDTEKAGRNRREDLSDVRGLWEDMTNQALEAAGHEARVDHRSLKEQGIDREPSQHLGVEATGYERRTGLPSDKRLRQEAVSELLRAAKEQGELEREEKALDRSILDLSGSLSAAIRERDSLQAEKLSQEAERSGDDFMKEFEQWEAAQKAPIHESPARTVRDKSQDRQKDLGPDIELTR